ncbi:MAG TPA: DNA polymerase III subunit gamma/tau [Burkholderiaceae bacterium]|nr:DNA polymerase III subunit gamma/tau [Burkholderiaceae bacterium]
MSYVVLARKYRPKNFAEMVGQSHVVTALGNALTTQRLHHAYLFTGTRGVGKTTVSRILAKSLNCVGTDGQGGITATPCGVCPACTDIDSGRFVDYTELDAASNRGVDEVQALLEQAVYKPVQGRFKVFMIDEVHMLTNTAFNAMLKTLEEPPDYLKFVLATTDPQKVPVTVLSRCLQFNLRPMAPETVYEHLVAVLQAEAVPAEPLALRLLSRAARGSMRDALSLTDQAIAFGDGQLQEATVRQMLGAVGRGHVFALIEALALGDGKAVVDTIDGLRLQGLSAASTLEEMTHVLQRMAVYQLANAEPDPADPEAPEVHRLSALLPADQTQLLYSLCLHGRTELGLATDDYAALVMVLLRLLAFQPPGVARVGRAEKKTLKSAARPDAATAASQVAAVAGPPSVAGPILSEPVQPHPVPEKAVAVVAAVDVSTSDPVDVPPDVVKNFDQKSAPALLNNQQYAPVFVGLPVVDVASAASEAEGQVPAQPGTVAARDAVKDAALDAGAADFWHALVLEMVRAESVNALVRELALQSELLARDASSRPAHWQLRVENATLKQAAVRDRLQAALAAHGHAVNLGIEVGPVSDTPARRVADAARQRIQQAEQTLLNDPYVQHLMQDFGGKIVPGTLKPIDT